MTRAIPFILTALLAPTLASASTAVVYDPAVGEKAVSAAWIAQHGSDADVRYISVDSVFAPDAPAILLGDVDAQPCAAEPADRAAFQALSAAADDAAFSMEYLAAATALERLARLLPCLTEVPDSAELSHFHLLRGVVAFYAQGEVEATRRFKEALLVTPFLQWNTRYPPAIRPSFEAAVRAALHAEKAFFSVSERIVEEGVFYVNGLAFDPRTRTANLYEGSHLLQWVPKGGKTATWMVQVQGGQFITLVHRQDGVDALLAGHADAGVTEFAMGRVLAPVEREAVSSVAVAEDWEVMLFHHYDVLSQQWRLADLEAIEIWRQTGRGVRAGGLAMVAGGVVAGLVGGLLGGRGHYNADGIVKDAAPYWVEVPGREFSQAPLSEVGEGAPRFAISQAEMRFGLALGVVGGALVLAGVPITVAGDGRAKAAGLSTRRRHKARGMTGREGKAGREAPAPSAEPSGPTEPTEPTEPSDSNVPNEPSEPTEPSASPEPTEPTEPTERTEERLDPRGLEGDAYSIARWCPSFFSHFWTAGSTFVSAPGSQ